MEAVARSNGRRSTLVVGLATVLVLTAVVAVRSAEKAKATSGGDPYVVPLVVDTNPDPNIVETTITADEGTVDIGNGVMANVQTYNGSIPGPEFRLKVGDTVIVHFRNNLNTEKTGIHWHGVELDNASDGTPITQNQVPPGGEFLYKFKVPRPGIFWYHPHHHSSTNQVFRGLYGSIIVTDPNEAALVSAGTLPNASRTRTVVLSDMTVCKAPGSNDAATYDPSLPHVSGGPLPAQPGPFPVNLCEAPTAIDEDGNLRPSYAAGDVPAIQKNVTAGRINEGQTVLTNGKNVGARAGRPGAPGALAPGASTLGVAPGQGLRLQVINSSAIRYMRLRLTTSTGVQIPLVRVGGEGGLLDNAIVEGGVVSGFDFKYAAGESLLGPGDRADLVAAIPASASGVATMWTEDFARTGMGFSNLPTVPVMHLNVTGAPGSYAIAAGTGLRAATGDLVPAIGAPTATLLDPSTFVPTRPGTSSQNIELTQSPTQTSLGINGVMGTHDNNDYTTAPAPGSARYAKIGDQLELTVENVTDAHHPFHLHGFSIQPLQFTRTSNPTYTFPYREFMDEIDIPARYTLTFRVRIDDRPQMDGVTAGGALGRWVMHCHIFFHAVNGMISELDIVAADGNAHPLVNSAAASVVVNEGQTATMTGTFSDPDGDAVTLSLGPPAIGTVVPTGPGTWSWSFTTSRGPDQSQVIYVTATDAGGRKNETAFQLYSLNLPPAVTINQTVGQADPTPNSPINFTAVFNEPVTGFTTGDVTISGGALPTTGTVAGGPASYLVAVTGMSTIGTVTASIGAGVATDLRGAGNLASTSADNTVFFQNGDGTPPACAVVAVRRAPGTASGRDEMEIRVTDTQSGLLTITNIVVQNGVVSITPSIPFPNGTTQATVTAIKTIQGQPTKFSFDATDRAGNVLHCA